MKNTRTRLVVALALFSGLAASSCKTQEDYQDAVAEAKRWQQEYYRLEENWELQNAEMRRLRDQLDVRAAAIEASNTDDIDQRLSDLQSIIAELGPNPGDVTKFRVDGGFVYRVRDSILFDTGSASVREDARTVLDDVAADIDNAAHGLVYVRGHTDNVPVAKPKTLEMFPHGNLQLSAARAVEVAAYLTEKAGMASGKVVVMGFGPNDPVADNGSAEGRQRNRRVDIFVADEGQ